MSPILTKKGCTEDPFGSPRSSLASRSVHRNPEGLEIPPENSANGGRSPPISARVATEKCHHRSPRDHASSRSMSKRWRKVS